MKHRRLISDIVFLVSSYMVVFSLFPNLLFLAPYFWPVIFTYGSLKLLAPLYLNIPFTFDLLLFTPHAKIFRDSIRALRLKPISLLLIPLFFLSFLILKPSLALWLPLTILSGISKVIKRANKHVAPPYHWRFKSEVAKSISPEYPLLRKTTAFRGKKHFECIRNEKPHVIFLFLESFRAKNVGALGAKHAYSPEFDKLAKEGALFTQFYANGLQTFRAMISSLFGIPAHIETMSLKPFCFVPMIGLPQILKGEGYHTAHFQGNCSSFDYSHPFLQKSGFETIRGDEHYPDLKKNSWGLLDEELFKEASAYLKGQEKPTFLSLWTISNHHPWESPMDFEVPEDLPLPYQKYLKTFAYTDHCLGKFIQQLKSDGVFDRSLIFIMGDHGQSIEDGNLVHNSLAQENIHIPLLITGVSPTTIHTPSSQVDLLPTVLDLLHLEAIHHSVGHSLVRKTESPVFLSLLRDETTLGSIVGEKKLLLNGEEEYFDLSKNGARVDSGPVEMKRDLIGFFDAIDSLYVKKAWVGATFQNDFKNMTFELRAPKDADDSWLESQGTLSPIIDLSNAVMTDAGITSMKEEQKGVLHELNISNNPLLSDRSLHWLAKNCKNLSILHAAGCPNVSEEGLREIVSLPKLRYLNLEGSQITQIPFKDRSNLNAIHLRNCAKLSGDALTQITKMAPKLIYFAASINEIENAHFQNLIWKDLNYLWLEDGKNITTEGLNAFLKEHPKLQILILDRFPNVDMLDLKNHTSLQSVKISNCPNLDAGAFTGIHHLNLKDLSIENCPKIAKDSVATGLPTGCSLLIS